MNFGDLKGYILAKPGVNTIPIYEMFAPTMNDRFYAFSWNEVQWQINDWKNENWGLEVTYYQNQKLIHNLFMKCIRLF